MSETTTNSYKIKSYAKKFLTAQSFATIVHSRKFVFSFIFILLVLFILNSVFLFFPSKTYWFNVIFCKFNAVYQQENAPDLTILYLIAPLITLLFTQSKEAIKDFQGKLIKNNDDTKSIGLEYEKFISNQTVKEALNDDSTDNQYEMIRDSINIMIERKSFFIKLIPAITALTTLLMLSGTILSVFPHDTFLFKASIIVLFVMYTSIFMLGLYFLTSFIRMYLFQSLIENSLKYIDEVDTL